MGKKIALSYIITTYNKLSFLKIVLTDLIKNKRADEEIIITDGGSNDGTPELLEKLKKEGKIDNYISEKDKGEAHGFNKGIWMSSGEIIKIITDDDAYYYPGIQACKNFMLENPKVDVLGANTGNALMENRDSLFWFEGFQNDYMEWKEGKLSNFFFNGTCLMIRRSSIPALGIFNPAVLLTDLEYTLRITGLANLGWYSGLVSIRILNFQSNNIVYKQRADLDSKKLCEYYNYKYPHERKTTTIKQLSFKKRLGYQYRNIVKSFAKRTQRKQLKEPFLSFVEAHAFCINWLNNHKLNKEPRFYYKPDNNSNN